MQIVLTRTSAWIFCLGMNFDIIMLTVAEIVLASCVESTATGVEVSKRSSTYYHAGCTADGDDTTILLVHCEPHLTEVKQRQKARPEYFDKKCSSKSCL